MTVSQDPSRGQRIVRVAPSFSAAANLSLYKLQEGLTYPEIADESASEEEESASGEEDVTVNIPFSANAVPVVYNPSTGELEEDDPSRVVTVYHPLALKSGDGEWVRLPQQLTPGDYVWATSTNDRWDIVAWRQLPWQRFKLTQPLWECGSAYALPMERSGSGYVVADEDLYPALLIVDSLRAVNESDLFLTHAASGRNYIPTGTCVNAAYVHGVEGDNYWEALEFSECECDWGSSSSSLESEESSEVASSSSSGSSSPPSSESESLSGPPPPPSSESESPSPSPSEGSESAPSESEGGSDKSTAIVPAPWSPTGYAALFTLESPQVRFDDLIIADGPISDRSLLIDPRFIAVCEEGTIEVAGTSIDLPLAIASRVENGRVQIQFAEQRPHETARLVIRLSGIRRGFRNHRFPERTQKQFEQNEAFINSAYDAR